MSAFNRNLALWVICLLATSQLARGQVSSATGDPRPVETVPFVVAPRLTTEAYQTEWRAYAANFLADDGRIVDNGADSISHSEGQGYGLLLADFARDDEAFARIWRWTRNHLQTRADHLLSWRWDQKKMTISDANNASDGDILVAWALARAARTFDQPRYADAAREIIESLGDLTLISTPFGPAILPGVDGFGRRDQKDGPILNPSYWVYPAFPTLAELDPRHDWAAVKQTGLALLSRSRFGPQALPGDWLSLNEGAPSQARNFSSDFGYNAIRIPLYLSWGGDAAERAQLARFAKLWRDARTPEFISATFAGPKPFVGSGYATIALLTRCAAGASHGDPGFAAQRDALYYPATLRMLSLIALQEGYKKCL